jgi:hypothetical protein
LIYGIFSPDALFRAFPQRNGSGQLVMFRNKSVSSAVLVKTPFAIADQSSFKASQKGKQAGE